MPPVPSLVSLTAVSPLFEAILQHWYSRLSVVPFARQGSPAINLGTSWIAVIGGGGLAGGGAEGTTNVLIAPTSETVGTGCGGGGAATITSFGVIAIAGAC